MKSFIFTNSQGTFNIEFKTDYIEGDNFTVHDISVYPKGGAITRDNAIRAGINFDILPYTLAGFKLFAQTNNLNLKEIDFNANETNDLITGASDDLDITTSSLDAGVVDTHYHESLVVTGGFKDYSFSIESGALPVGLILDPNSGVIYGTPTGAETANFTIRVTDELGQINDQALSIEITA